MFIIVPPQFVNIVKLIRYYAAFKNYNYEYFREAWTNKIQVKKS